MLYLVAGSRVNQQVYLGAPAFLESCWLAGTSSTLRLGVERRRRSCAGTWRPPPFVEKLLSGKRDQGDRDCVHGRDLIAGSNTLCECFNNVDVGVPLWLTEPRDKSSSQRVCFLSSPFKFPHFILQLVCFYFLSVVSC